MPKPSIPTIELEASLVSVIAPVLANAREDDEDWISITRTSYLSDDETKVIVAWGAEVGRGDGTWFEIEDKNAAELAGFIEDCWECEWDDDDSVELDDDGSILRDENGNVVTLGDIKHQRDRDEFHIDD